MFIKLKSNKLPPEDVVSGEQRKLLQIPEDLFNPFKIYFYANGTYKNLIQNHNLLHLSRLLNLFFFFFKSTVASHGRAVFFLILLVLKQLMKGSEEQNSVIMISLLALIFEDLRVNSSRYFLNSLLLALWAFADCEPIGKLNFWITSAP